jgi:O-6-methylguanine DNA methyltransferase
MNDMITNGLARLRTTAPPGMAGRVLAELDLIDRYARIDGPIGPMYVAFNGRGISAVVPVADEEAFLEHYRERVGGAAPVPGELPALMDRRLRKAITTGKLGTLPLDLGGLTDFQRKVLMKAAEIPPGQVRPYGWIAKELGMPGAVRAVGSALNKNPAPVVIPCHRVGRSDGTLGKYAFGEEMKRELLESEGLEPDYEDLAERGVRFVGSDTTRIYCYPTCRHARRVSDAHEVRFPSRGVAEAAGYRGCKVCRPAA